MSTTSTNETKVPDALPVDNGDADTAAKSAALIGEDGKPKTAEELLAEELKLPPWPPTEVNNFREPTNYLAKLENSIPFHVVNLEEHGADGKPTGQTKPAIFFCHFKNFDVPKGEYMDPTDWDQYQLPDNRGLIKLMLIHRATNKKIAELQNTYPVIDVKFHPIPNPDKNMRNVFGVKAMYIMPGGAAYDEVETGSKCENCGIKSALVCQCRKHNFCSAPCRAKAEIKGIHSREECMAGLRQFIADSIGSNQAKLNDLAIDLRKRQEQSVKVAEETHRIHAAKMAQFEAEKKELLEKSRARKIEFERIKDIVLDDNGVPINDPQKAAIVEDAPVGATSSTQGVTVEDAE